MMVAGGRQSTSLFADSVIYIWQFHVDWIIRPIQKCAVRKTLLLRRITACATCHSTTACRNRYGTTPGCAGRQADGATGVPAKWKPRVHCRTTLDQQARLQVVLRAYLEERAGLREGKEIEQCIQLDRGFCRPKRSPITQRQANSIEVASTRRERVSERRARRSRAQSHVKQFGLMRGQTHLDVAQQFPPRELRDRHGAEHLRAPQRPHAGTAAVTGDDAPERLPRHELHHLREQGLANVQATLRVELRPEHRSFVRQNSNRGHPTICETPHQH